MADLGVIGMELPSMIDVMSGVTTVVTLLIFIGAIGFGFWFLTKNKKLGRFPVAVDIFQVKNGSLKWVDGDSARRKKKKDGEEYYEFKKRKIKWSPPTFQAMVNTAKGKSKLYLKELSHDSFEILDMAQLVTAGVVDYKKVETDHVVRFWKVLEGNKARFKWNKDNSWDKLINALPIVLSLFGLGLFFYFFGNYILVPTLATTGTSNLVLEKATQVLDASIRYMEGMGVFNTTANITIVNGTGVIT